MAPVGGTMCAASPARNSRPYRIGALTKLRIGVMPLSRIGPSFSSQPGRASRFCSWAQIRPSGQAAMSSSGGTCRYSRLSAWLRRLCRANPSG